MIAWISNLGAIRERKDEPELLELNEGSTAEARESLEDMERYNRYLGGKSFLRQYLFPLIADRSTEPIRIVDVGCGGAGMSMAAADFARRSGISIQIVGVDLDDRSISFARERAGAYSEIGFVKADAGALPFRENTVDLAFSTLFFHHLTPEAGVRFLSQMLKACRGTVLVHDLVRNRLAAFFFRLTAPLLTKSYLTKYDGLVSIYRAYNPVELKDLFARAGRPNTRIASDPIFFRMTAIAGPRD